MSKELIERLERQIEAVDDFGEVWLDQKGTLEACLKALQPATSSDDKVVISIEDAIDVTQILLMYADGDSAYECVNPEASMKAAENLKLRIDQAIQLGGWIVSDKYIENVIPTDYMESENDR